MLFAAHHHVMSKPGWLAAPTVLGTARGNWCALRRTAINSPIRLLGIFAISLALAAPAWAEVSRDQAAVAAQRQTGGRVLSVDKTEAGRRTVWRVKVVTPRGEVRVVFIDADAGRGG